MKNLILSAALLFSLATHANTVDAFPENENVVKTFKDVFKDAHNISWNNTGKYYEAFFTIASVKTRATIDGKGRLVQTIRYYNESELPAKVIYSVKKEFPNKDIFGVTEISNKFGTTYKIILKDDTNYIHINANSIGETEVVADYERGDVK